MSLLRSEFLPFILDEDPGWNKTAITVPNSFIKSIATCSPECVAHLVLQSSVVELLTSLALYLHINRLKIEAAE